MSVNLQKGQKISLDKEAGGTLTKITMGLGWDAVKTKGFLGFGGKTEAVDLDASVVMFDEGNRLVDTVWFRQLKSKDGSIVHTGDNRTGAGDGDDEQINVAVGSSGASRMGPEEDDSLGIESLHYDPDHLLELQIRRLMTHRTIPLASRGEEFRHRDAVQARELEQLLAVNGPATRLDFRDGRPMEAEHLSDLGLCQPDLLTSRAQALSELPLGGGHRSKGKKSLRRRSRIAAKSAKRTDSATPELPLTLRSKHQEGFRGPGPQPNSARWAFSCPARPPALLLGPSP